MGSDSPLLAAKACEASGITLSTGKRAALSPLLKHSSHDHCCNTLLRGEDDTASVYSHPASFRFGKTVAERQLQSFGGVGSTRITPKKKKMRDSRGEAVRREVIIGPCLYPH